MKRKGNLYGKITSFQHLYEAYIPARKGKRNRGSTIMFDLSLEEELFKLQNELLTKTYQLSPYYTFKIFEPKERIIKSLPFRDRVVQHVLVNHVLEPIFEKQFIYQNVACRKGKGTHFGLQLTGKYLQNQYKESVTSQMELWEEGGWVLKCDISKFFYRIKHDILKKQYRRLIKDPDVLWLLDTIVDSTEGREGIPIGNLTSQYFALFYMSGFDHFVKEQLKIKRYVRYMDDFLLIHDSKEYLRECLVKIQQYLHVNLELELNAKTQLTPIRNGVDFLGFHTYITPTGKIVRKLRQDSKRRMKRKLKFFSKTNQRDFETINHCVQSWIGHAKNGNTYNLRKKLLSNFSNKK